jgi:hypothetical protein
MRRRSGLANFPAASRQGHDPRCREMPDLRLNGTGDGAARMPVMEGEME